MHVLCCGASTDLSQDYVVAFCVLGVFTAFIIGIYIEEKVQLTIAKRGNKVRKDNAKWVLAVYPVSIFSFLELVLLTSCSGRIILTAATLISSEVSQRCSGNLSCVLLHSENLSLNFGI